MNKRNEKSEKKEQLKDFVLRCMDVFYLKTPLSFAHSLETLAP